MKVYHHSDSLHLEASNQLFGYAKEMRKKATEAEGLLWSRLKNGKVAGMKFRRQHPIEKYIADFYCHEKKLIIEVDGDIHSQAEQKQIDKVRTDVLKELNVTVVRFRIEEVILNIDSVIAKIIEACKKL